MNDPYYSSSRSRRNAELWAAMTGMGAIYGKVPGASNSTRVDISPDPKPRPPYTTYGYSLTYNFADPAIGSDDAYQENYAIGDVKPGNYTITALSGSYRRTVTVKAGQVVNADAPAGFVREDIPPDGFELFQNFPNPFNPTTTIRFALAATSLVKLTVYDLLGRELEVLVDEELSPGTYTIPWNASGMGSGIYFYQLRAGNFQKTMSMMLVR
jgi:hypothetical protein